MLLRCILHFKYHKGCLLAVFAAIFIPNAFRQTYIDAYEEPIVNLNFSVSGVCSAVARRHCNSLRTVTRKAHLRLRLQQKRSGNPYTASMLPLTSNRTSAICSASRQVSQQGSPEVRSMLSEKRGNSCTTISACPMKISLTGSDGRLTSWSRMIKNTS